MSRLLRSTLSAMCALIAGYAIWTVPALVRSSGVSGAGIALAAIWLALAALAVPIARGRIMGSRFWVLATAMLVLSRIVALALAAGRTPIGDAAIYPAMARALLAGHGFVDIDAAMRTDYRALYPPVYPTLLAAAGLIGGVGMATVWLLDLLLSLTSLALLARLGTRIGDAAAGRAAIWLFAIWPGFALASPFAQKETLEQVLALALALLMIERGQGWRRASAIGLAAALLALTQPGLAPLAGVFALATIPERGARATVTLGLRALPAALIAMAPWWFRNWSLFGRFVPLTSTTGLGLWIGNNPHATGNWMRVPESLVGLPELRQSALGAALARDWIVSHPFGFVVLSATKLVRALGVEQDALARLARSTPPPPDWLAPTATPLLQASLVAMLATAAVAIARGPTGAIANRLFAGCIAQMLCFLVWFEFGERHRDFAVPFLILAIGCALSRTSRRAARPTSPRRDG